MPINGMDLIVGATAYGAPTGGTAEQLAPVGVEVKNGIHVADTTNTNYLTRVNVTYQNRNSVLQSDGTYSKHKRSGKVVMPIELADGTYSYALVRWDVEYHPEMTSAQINSLRFAGIESMGNSDTNNFIHFGDLS